jgi:hypothetical protein
MTLDCVVLKMYQPDTVYIQKIHGQARYTEMKQVSMVKPGTPK